LSAAIAFFEDLVEVGASIDVVERPALDVGVEAGLLRARSPPDNSNPSRRAEPSATRTEAIRRLASHIANSSITVIWNVLQLLAIAG
jgi:hypothetical protein